MTPHKLAERFDAAIQNGAQSLDLSGLGLKAFPELPEELKAIAALRLGRNRLTEFPAAVLALGRLEILDLGANRLSELPADIVGLDRLANLDLSENRLVALPSTLFQCDELRSLSLYANRIEVLPLAGPHNDNLKRLDLSFNALISLAGLSSALPGLTWLDASGNRLTDLEGIDGLDALSSLDLSGNALTSAATLAGLTALSELRLDGNELAVLPPELAALPRLRVFSADGNPLGPLPAAFDQIASSALRANAQQLFAEHVSGGGQPGREYFNAPSLFFDFALLLSGTFSLLRFVDLYFKHGAARSSIAATMRFADGSVIELSHLSRKATLDLVRQHESSLEAKGVKIAIEPALAAERDAALDLLAKTIASIPAASMVSASGATHLTLVNGPLVQTIQQELKVMRDVITNSGIFNFRSHLENVTQTIAASPADDAAKKELIELMTKLSGALAKVPDAQKLDAEAVAEAAKEVVEKATRPNPNKKSVDISAKGLLEAAKSIVEIVPIATGLVAAVGKLVGLG